MDEPDSPWRRLPELRWQPVLAVERIRKTTHPSQKQRGGVVHHLAFDLFRERIAVGCTPNRSLAAQLGDEFGSAFHPEDRYWGILSWACKQGLVSTMPY